MTLPNTKNSLLIIASLAVIFGTFFLVEYRNTQSADVVYVDSSKTALNQVTADVSEKDSDNDGLKDWEEVLWNTDPYKKDTDGNGIPDNVEVAKKTQEKQLASANTSVTSAQNAASKKNESKIDQFSKEFFNNYLKLRKSGSLDQTSINNLTTEAALEVTSDQTADPYTIAKIQTFPDSNAAAVKNYANEFASIYTKYQLQYTSQKIAVPQSGPDFTDPALVKSFENAASLYKNMANELAKLPVPSSLAQTHVDILNAYILSFRGLWAISATQKDPIAALKGLSLHNAATNTENASLLVIKQYFNSKGIVFAPGEAGVFWNSI